MVGLIPSGDFYSRQCIAEPPSLGDQPPPPLTLNLRHDARLRRYVRE